MPYVGYWEEGSGNRAPEFCLQQI